MMYLVSTALLKIACAYGTSKAISEYAFNRLLIVTGKCSDAIICDNKDCRSIYVYQPDKMELHASI